MRRRMISPSLTNLTTSSSTIKRPWTTQTYSTTKTRKSSSCRPKWAPNSMMICSQMTTSTRILTLSRTRISKWWASTSFKTKLPSRRTTICSISTTTRNLSYKVRTSCFLTRASRTRANSLSFWIRMIASLTFQTIKGKTRFLYPS